ncbi:MAG: ABC transporter ATP-binding protein [Clostridium sp.]
MLNVKNLCFNYEKREVLRNLSFSLEKGETLAIIGPSGCGKSTLLLALAGLLDGYKGKITESFNDNGLILQNNSLFPWKTVEENISMGLIARGYSKSEAFIRTEEIANRLNIKHILKKFPSEISGGEKQRAAVCRVLVFNPELLLLDEPSSALDLINKDRFQNLLYNIQNEYNLSYILVTHNIEEAVFLGKRIGIMVNGEIKSILENDFYGRGQMRKSYEFFRKCHEIRELLEGYEGDE